MVFEDGVDWQPLEPRNRGRHASFGEAVEAAYRSIARESDDFFLMLPERFETLFPDFPARPGRYDNGKLVLFVKSAPALFALKPRLPSVRRALASLEGAPKNLKLILEIHA